MRRVALGLGISLAALGVGCHRKGVTGTSSQSSSGSGGGAPTCKAANADGIELASISAIDPTKSLGYPPYAVDGCTLLYLAPGPSPTSTGELRVRDLSSGMERVLATESELPSRPAISGSIAAWEATENGKRAVRTVDVTLASATPETVQGPFDHAGEPRVASGSIVFTAWLAAPDTSDTDVYVYDVASGSVSRVATGPGQQRFADISPTHVAWSDFSEGPTGVFNDQSGDASNIVVMDRASGLVTTRTKPGKQAFPMLGVDGKIAYLDWGLVHPEPKLSEYDLRLGDIAGLVDADVLVAHIQTTVYLRPVARGSYLEWVETSPANGEPSLKRAGVDLTLPPATVSTFAGETVVGPTADPSITLVGTMAPNMPPHLQAFAR